MDRFVNGTKVQFNALAEMLEDGKCHVFKDCKLPLGTKPTVTRIGFEKTATGYKTMVDYGIVSNADNNRFKSFLEVAEAKFQSISEMQEFFNDFSSLFNTPNGEVVNIENIEKLRIKQNQRKHVRPEEIGTRIKAKIFGQDEAIDKLAHEISAHQIAPADRPLVLSILGPCGVGKSETSQSLAKIMSDLYGIKYGFIAESGNTIMAEHAVQKFLGAPPSYTGHGQPTVLDPVRKNPNHVILIDEIEKAHPNLLIALMEALDIGFLSMNDNSPKIDLRKCVVIFTSNLPVEMNKYTQLDDFEKTAYCRDLFTDFTNKPEISRRISEFIVFNSLKDRAKIKIIIRYLQDELSNYGAELLKADEALILSFLELDAKYGASELRDYVRKAVAYKLSETNTPDVYKGKKIKLSGSYKDILIEVE